MSTSGPTVVTVSSQAVFKGQGGIRTAVAMAASLVLCAVVLVGVPHAQAAPDCSAPPGPGVDWSGCDKSGVSIPPSGVDEPIDMTGARLVGTNFRGAGFTGVTLDSADMTDADLTKAGFAGVSMQNATLSRANFSGGNIDSSTFDGSQMNGANMTGLEVDFSSLRRVSLVSADLTKLFLENGDNDFSNADLTNAVLTDAQLDSREWMYRNTLDGITSAGNIGTPASLPFGWKWESGKSRLYQVISTQWLAGSTGIKNKKKTKVLTIKRNANKIKSVKGWCSKESEQADGEKFKPAKLCKPITKFSKNGKNLNVFVKPDPWSGKKKCRPNAAVNVVIKTKKQLAGGSSKQAGDSVPVIPGNSCGSR